MKKPTDPDYLTPILIAIATVTVIVAESIIQAYKDHVALPADDDGGDAS